VSVDQSRWLMRCRRAGIFSVFALFLVFFNFGCHKRPVSRATPQMDAAEKFWIRVLVGRGYSKCELSMESAFVIRWDGGKTSKRFEIRSGVVSAAVVGGRLKVAGEIFDGGEVVVVPESPHIFEFNGVKYRGRSKLLVDEGGASFSVINEVPLKPYLGGVVGAEMPSYWEPAALEAQAIAARTYCLYIKRRFGVNRSWDVRKNESSQVYTGLSGECGAVWSAVNGTSGQVLYCEDGSGHEGLFPTYYSSACGGHTENSKHVFGDSFKSLVGVECDYCRRVAKPRIFFWPMVCIDKSEVSRRLVERYPSLGQLGRIVEIVTHGESRYKHFSRLTSIKLVGEKGGSSFVRAEDFRLSVDPSGRRLRSTVWEMVDLGKQWGFLSGRGYGHGVGMCQCGAEGMARAGKTAKEILRYYYPGSKIMNVY